MNQPAANQPLPAPIIWGETNVGKQRTHNEDQVYPDSRHKTSLRPPTPQAVQARGYLLVVADGIGGAQVGDTAANFAVRAVTDHYYADPRAMSLDRLLQSAVEIANTNVYNYVRTSPAFQQAGCTLTAAAIRGNELVVAHVGDSRAYLLQDGKINRLTRDHNVAEMMASGQPLPGGGQGLAGNMLVRSLGAGPAVEVEVYRPILKPGDTVLLCSDGLHGVVSDEEIRQIASRETPEKGARKLIDLANARGGPDNISVVIARLPGGAAAAAPAGAKSSNRITALAIASLALLGVLAVMLFALNQLGSGRNTATATTTVEVIASLPSPETPTPLPASVSGTATVGGVMETDTAIPAATGETPGGVTTPTEGRPPTSTPALTDTPTAPPTRTPTPTRLPATATPTRTQGSSSSALAPTLVSPPNGSQHDNSVDLQWSHGDLADGQKYRVRLSTDPNRSDKELYLTTVEKRLQVGFDQQQTLFTGDLVICIWSVMVINADGSQASGSSAEWRFTLKREAPTSTPLSTQSTVEPATSEPATPEPPKTPPPP